MASAIPWTFGGGGDDVVQRSHRRMVPVTGSEMRVRGSRVHPTRASTARSVRRGWVGRLLPALPFSREPRLRDVPDSGLIDLIVQGDRQAFAELYDRYSELVYGLALRVTCDTQFAEEVVKETLLTVWRQAPLFDARRGRPSVWLLTITHHKAVGIARREHLRRGDPADRLSDVPDGTDDAREARPSEQSTVVCGALSCLTDAQRTVIELAYFHGYTQSQVADKLGEPLATIKSRTHAALTRLGALLTEDRLRATTSRDTASSVAQPWRHR
jgi:RNA polymerase sigma factor (sigma-70 family)